MIYDIPVPQFDILWDALSGEEHLKLFASIKGLPPSSINSVCTQMVEMSRVVSRLVTSNQEYFSSFVA